VTEFKSGTRDWANVSDVPIAIDEVKRSAANEDLSTIAKALGDPIRLQIVDVLRTHAGEVCVCELVPLFDVSQPTLSHHLKKLRDAGLVDSVKAVENARQIIR